MNERLSRIINSPNRVPVSIGVVSFGAGLGLGYILGKRNRSRITHIIPRQPLDYDNLDNFIEREEKRLGINTDEILDKNVIIPKQEIDVVTSPRVREFVANHIKEEMTTPKTEPEEVPSNIFANGSVEGDDWDYVEEVAKRSNQQPYILHKDEFYAEEKDYSQITLTYYAGDNIMADEDDTPVYNHEDVTGPLIFGHGSGDPKVVYVRNDKRKAEYEIIHDPGLYSVEVLGLEMEHNERAENIKHSAPKFKMIE